jgi:hypothetical protein
MWKRTTLLLALSLWFAVPFSASQSQEGYPDYLVDYLESLDSAVQEWEALQAEIAQISESSLTISKEQFSRIVQDLIDSKRSERNALVGEQNAIEIARTSQETSEKTYSLAQRMHEIQVISNIVGAVLTTAVLVLVVVR